MSDDPDAYDSSPTPDLPSVMEARAGSLSTSDGANNVPGHVHEANSRVWAQLNDPFYLADGVTVNAALRPGDIWLELDFQAWSQRSPSDYAAVSMHIFTGYEWAGLP